MKKDVFEDHLEMADGELTRLSELVAEIDPIAEPDKYERVLDAYCKVQDMVNDARTNYESLEKLAQEDRKIAVSRANKKDDVKSEGIKTVGSVAAAFVGGFVSLFGLKKVIDAENDEENPKVIRPSLKGWCPSNPFKKFM